jgi:dolichyl-phosphate beta-glucosyltransferase
MISIVIAAYNEEKRIGESLRKIADYFRNSGKEYEVLVVDDGSRDGTSQVVKNLGPLFRNLEIVCYGENRGKGYALRQGVLASKGDVVLVTDADLSTPIEELDKLMPLVTGGDCDVAIGSRALARSDIIKKQPFWRQGMGKIFNKIVKFLVIDDFNDTQCGFKLFSGDVARELFGKARIDRFAYDVEILALAKKRKCRILEQPIRWLNSPDSRVNPLFDSLQMIKDLVRIWMHVGRFRKQGSGGLIDSVKGGGRENNPEYER